MERARALVLGAAGLALAGLGLSALLLRDDPARVPTPSPSRSPEVGVSSPTPGLSSAPTASSSPSPRASAKPTSPTVSSALAVSGWVRDIHRQPVSGARVSAVAAPSLATTAGADGAFSLELPRSWDPGKRVALVASGPSPLAPRVAPGALPGSRDVTIVLRPGDGTFVGRVVREGEKRTAVAGASVEATLGDWLARARTDAEGRFRLEGAPAGALALVVSGEGCVPRALTLAQGRGTGAEQVIVLEPGTRLAGTVTRSGKPVAGARVRLHESDVPLAFADRETVSDSSGAFAIDALPACEALVHARGEGGISPVVVVRSDGNQAPEPLALELGPGAAVFGHVVASGSPVADARVVLRDSLEGAGELEARTTADGAFRIEPVEPAGSEARALALRVEAAGFAPSRVGATPGQEQTVELQRGASLTVSASGSARVEVRDSRSELHAATLEASGESTRETPSFEHTFTGLPAGPTWVIARAEGRACVPQQVALVEGGTAGLQLELGAGRKIAGTCKGDDGLLLGGVSIVALDPSAGSLGPSAVALSSEDGRFELASAPEGKLTLVATLAGYLDARLDLEPGAASADLELPRSYALEVTLASDAGPVARALLTLTPLEGKGERREQVVNDASAVLGRLRGTRYRLEALVPGLAPLRQEVDPRAATSVALALGAGASADGVVLGPDGAPVPGAAIVLGTDPNEDLNAKGSFARLLAMTDSKGAFQVTLSSAGEDVVLTCPDLAPLVTHLVPGSGQKLTLVEGAKILGRALGRDGSPQPGVGVALEGPLSRRASSGPDGSFTFAGLLPGRYRLRRHDAAPDSPGVEASVGEKGSTSVELRAP